MVTTKDLSGNVAKKVRKVGKPSISTPPLDAPAWAVKTPSDFNAVNEGINFTCVPRFFK